MIPRPIIGVLLAAAVCFAQDAKTPTYQKDTEATQARPAPGSDDLLWMNPLKWTWVKADHEDTSIYFHKSGAAQARLIVTPEGKTPEVQLEETLDRIRKLDPKAHVAYEEKRIVNGAPMLCTQIVAKGPEAEEEMVYYGYLYGNEERSVQLFTIAPRSAMTALYIELTSLLNGLEIRERTAAP